MSAATYGDSNLSDQHQLLSTHAPPSHHRPQASTHCLTSSCPFSALEQLTHSTTQVQKAPTPMPSPPIPVPGHLGDHPPIPRQALTHIVILEGMEKVASQLPVVSWSARGIANATYVVWRILWETGGEVVSRTMPWGRTQPCPPQSHSLCPQPPGSQQHPSAEESPHTHPATNPTYFWKSIYVS